jgi:hypothetical protein
MTTLCIQDLHSRERVVDIVSLNSVRRKRLERYGKDACSGLNGVIAEHVVSEALKHFDANGDEETACELINNKVYAQRTRHRVHAWRGQQPDDAA